MNRLREASSPYLRKASAQKVDWRPYGEEAFREAREVDRPVFLSSGAVWCHWCHVQAAESFEREDVAALINENYIPVKLDRDERPDVDRRYQEALAAMGRPGGWPLSIFLTPEGKPFYGGTYFAVEDTPEAPGFKTVLREVAGYYRENREKAFEYSGRIMEYLNRKKSAGVEKDAQGAAITALDIKRILEEGASSILSGFDPRYGGFGFGPKFPMPGIISFLAGRYFFERDTGAGRMIKHVVDKTLSGMVKGGIHDVLGGGFHRYAVDSAWTIPHFEKLAEDNAWHLRNFLEWHLLAGGDEFLHAARGIINYVRETLSAPQGGFYSSQDADIEPSDEGGYFTWTEEELRIALNEEEFAVFRMGFLHEDGIMPHDPERHVLFTAVEAVEISKKTGMPAPEVERMLSSALTKLLVVRKERAAPFVDETLYSSVNGLFSSSFMFAWRVLGDDYLLNFALRSLDETLRRNLKEGDLLFHSAGAPAVLDDYVHMTGAFIDAYENTGERFWLERASGLARALIRDFWDKEGAGFFDRAEEEAGVLLKNIEDVPYPSANALAVWHLMRLYFITGNEEYRSLAERSLVYFAGRAKKAGLYAGTYFSVLDGLCNYLALRVEAPAGSGLAQAALWAFRPYKMLSYGAGSDIVVPCVKGKCLEPLRSPEAVRQLVADNKIPAPPA